MTMTTLDTSIAQDSPLDDPLLPMIASDAGGYIVQWSMKAQDMFGYSAEEIIGQHAEILHQRCREDLEREVLAPLKREGHLEFFGKLIRKSGEVFDASIRLLVTTAPDGKITGMVGYCDDHNLAVDTRRQFEQIVSASPDMMSLVGPDYKYLAVNDAYVKNLCRSKRDILGHRVSEFVDEPKFRELVKPKLDASLAGHSGRLEAWFDYPDIGPRFMDIVYEPVHDNDDIIGVAVSIRDTTDRRKIEDDLKVKAEQHQRAENATESESIGDSNRNDKAADLRRQYEHIVSASPDMMSLVGPDYKY